MYCSNCGAQTPDGYAYCSKCGRQIAPPIPQAQPMAAATFGKRTSGMAIASLVLGIAGFFLGFLWMIPSILAIIFGAIALSQTNRGQNLGGRGMALAGLICGIVAGILWLFLFIIAASLPANYYSV